MDRTECIAQLQALTSNILTNLYELDFEQLEAFVESRQRIVDLLIEHLSFQQATAEEKVLIENMLNHDGEIMLRMNVLRLEAQDWLSKRGQAKTQRDAYEAGYSPDSILMDKRK